MRVLVTGGAGFIGSHIVDSLLARGHRPLVVDSIHPQVHTNRRVPAYLSSKADFVRGDIRNRKLMSELLSRVDAVIHQASLVGVGQSMYEIEQYVDINTRGTALLLELISTQRHSIRKLLVASSMSIYGEGSYRCPKCGPVFFPDRQPQDLHRGLYEPFCARHRLKLKIEPTPETKPLLPTSIYALTKRDQEEMCLMIGRVYGIPTVALRYFNVYGPRQSLSNPYTGVLAIFGSRLLNNHPPLIFEDGLQSRDFVHVRDVAAANMAALEDSKADGMVLNVGTGVPRTVLDIARRLADALGKKIPPKILGYFRVGDIRHCIANIGQIQTVLGWSPKTLWENGLEELVTYIRFQKSRDNARLAIGELTAHRIRRKIVNR